MTNIQDRYQHTCKSCGHFIQGNKKLIDDYVSDLASGKVTCDVCYKNGNKVHMLRTTVCSACKQVIRSEQTMMHDINCSAEYKGVGLTIVNRFQKSSSDTIKDQMNMDKSQELLRTRVEKTKLEIINEPARLLKQIIVQNEKLITLQKDSQKIKPTPKINHGAIL